MKVTATLVGRFLWCLIFLRLSRNIRIFLDKFFSNEQYFSANSPCDVLFLTVVFWNRNKPQNSLYYCMIFFSMLWVTLLQFHTSLLANPRLDTIWFQPLPPLFFLYQISLVHTFCLVSQSVLAPLPRSHWWIAILLQLFSHYILFCFCSHSFVQMYWINGYTSQFTRSYDLLFLVIKFLTVIIKMQWCSTKTKVYWKVANCSFQLCRFANKIGFLSRVVLKNDLCKQ